MGTVEGKGEGYGYKGRNKRRMHGWTERKSDNRSSVKNCFNVETFDVQRQSRKEGGGRKREREEVREEKKKPIC